MTNDELDFYLELLESKGWKVRRTLDNAVALNEAFRLRYPRILEDYLRFLRRVAECSNPSDTVWFLCAGDYNDTRGLAFRWNELELMELEGANGEEKEESEIRQFWDRHLPFMLSVGGDYAYLALRVSGEHYGSVVDGYDIALRDVSQVAATFTEFVLLHRAALNGDFGETLLRDYV